MDVSGCAGQVNSVLYMEHVQAKVTLSYSRRGDIKLNLISPSGTKSTLLPVSFHYYNNLFRNSRENISCKIMAT